MTAAYVAAQAAASPSESRPSVPVRLPPHAPALLFSPLAESLYATVALQYGISIFSQGREIMSEHNRVRQWRESKRQQGLRAITVWLTTEEEGRLKDLALTYHCSPSELVQQALAQFRPSTLQYISNITDRELIREVVREELTAMQATQALIPEDARTSIETLTKESLAAHVTELRTGTPVQLHAVHEPLDVTDTATVTVTVTDLNSRPRGYGEVPAAVLAALAHHQPATPAEIAHVLGDGTKAGTKRVWQALQRLCNSGKVRKEGKQYRLPA